MDVFQKKYEAEKVRRQNAEEQRDIWEKRFREELRKSNREQHSRESVMKRGDLRHQLSEAVLECSKVELENRVLRQRNQRLETALADAKNTENSLRKELEIWKLSDTLRDPERLRAAETIVSVEWLTQENLKLRRELRVIEENERHFQEELLRAQNSKENLRLQFREVQQQLEGELKHTNELRCQGVAQLEQELELQQQNKSLGEENRKLLADVAQLQEQCRCESSSAEMAQKEVSALRGDVERLQGWLQEERRINQSKDSTLEKLRSLVEELDVGRKNDRAQLAHYEGTMKPLQAETSALHYRLQVSQKELFECREELSKSDEALRAFRASSTSLANANEELSSLKKREKQLQTELSQSRADASVLERAKVDLEHEQQVMRRDHDESEAALLSMLDHVRSQAESLSKENLSLTQQIDVLQKEVSRFQLLLAHHSRLSATARRTALNAKDSSRVLEMYDIALSPETPHPKGA